ncbi:hypothetical protein E4Z66_15905 [Aliishimia ponticola]|uniref:Uncharacterized protein n=1 Tax=Aliishimia ponticola TaxID=2499833 RepID=A0A4S4NBE2_9RHOB|nr:hypothetical protein [Aliishimia ponticola]THH35301.1 hypothetical protein E4Z66_15905 [Aliishimia ponticola]
MARDDADGIAAHIAELNDLCAQMEGDLLLSCEDLAGDLPGRAAKRRIYPQLMRHLNTLRNGLRGRVVFYFFTREANAWLRSAYVQSLKHHKKFRSFDGFLGFLNNTDGIWDGILARPRAKLGADFIEIPYQEGGDFSAIRALLEVILGDGATEELDMKDARRNSAPSDEVVELLELLNSSGASLEAIRAAKKSLLTEATPKVEFLDADPSEWPPAKRKPDWLSEDLIPLWSRVEARANWQLQPDLMPPFDCDLSALRRRPMDAPDTFPEGGRNHMENQVKILAYRFRGMPEICYILGLTISYLRRQTGHEEHATFLFQRLWNEEFAVLLGVLPTRWLISTFQTFMDHGVNENQRLIGAAAYFMSNTLKLYEAERALDGLPPGRPYPNVAPATKSGFWGLDRFQVGGTDLMLNSNALLLELAARDDTAGRVVQEFMLRLKKSDTAFSRMDKTRYVNKIEHPQFSNCWSFHIPPDIKE